MSYEAVIGLEIHAQLQTQSKIFCGCSTAFGRPPNSNVCPVCLGFPGALPVLNHAAVDLAIRAGLALGCRINGESVFARKNYFYPDLPKGYQISQYELPIAIDGAFEFSLPDGPCRVGITRAHMEEDAGKSLHDGFTDSDRKTYVDYNRSGVPLIEIVTEPDLRSSLQAAEFFTRLRELLVWIGVNDGNMEEGSLRCDANVSVRPAGTSTLGTKAEIKNLNSFRFLQKAIDYEIDRQIELLTDGGRVVQETRLWDAAAGVTVSMRSKEEAHDYRYFPEPDLPRVQAPASRVDAIRAAMPELPQALRVRLIDTLQLPEHLVAYVTSARATAAFFAEAVAAGAPAKTVATWMAGDLARLLNERKQAYDRSPVTPARLAELLALVDAGTISGPVAKTVLETMVDTGRAAADIVQAEGLRQIDDESAIVGLIQSVLDANADAVASYRGGKTATFGFLVGQVMKVTAGKANPKRVNELLRRALDA